MNGGFYLRTEGVDRFAQVVGELHPQPIARCLTKVSGKMKIGFGGDPTLLVDDFVDALLGELRVFRQAVGGEAHGPKELLAEQFARMDIEVLFHGLVIVGDFNFLGVLANPPETHPVLVVNPDAVLAGPVAFEGFEPVARGKAQFVEPAGGGACFLRRREQGEWSKEEEAVDGRQGGSGSRTVDPTSLEAELRRAGGRCAWAHQCPVDVCRFDQLKAPSLSWG